MLIRNCQVTRKFCNHFYDIYKKFDLQTIMNYMFLYVELYISSIIPIIQMYVFQSNKHRENNLYNYIFKQKLILFLRSSLPSTKRTTKLSWLPNNHDRLFKSDTRFFYLVFIRSLSHCSLNFQSSISTCLLPRFIIVIYTEFVHYTALCYQDYITLRGNCWLASQTSLY